jgi:DNA-binding MarR family transcriptional regulator
MMYEISDTIHEKGPATTALRNLPCDRLFTADSVPATTSAPDPPNPARPPATAEAAAPPLAVVEAAAPDPLSAHRGAATAPGHPAAPAAPQEPLPGPESTPESAPPAGFWLHQAALTWRAQLDLRLRPLGLTPTQFLLLSAADRLERRGGPATQQEVAEQAGADRMMTSKVLRLLEKRGLLSRTAHESDARSMRVALSVDGRVLAERAAAIAREFDDAFFGDGAELLGKELQAVAGIRGR